MKRTIKILGIPGSLRNDSYNKAALEAAKELAPECVELEIFDLSGIPVYDPDKESNPPEAVKHLKEKIRESDAIIFATPEYNYSVSGALKNAIDWASRPYGDSAWEGKPAAIMGAATGNIGTARAQYDLRKMFVFLNIQALNQPEVMISKAADKFDSEGKLTDEYTKKKIIDLLFALVNWTISLEDTEQTIPKEQQAEQHYNFGQKGGQVQKNKD